MIDVCQPHGTDRLWCSECDPTIADRALEALRAATELMRNCECGTRIFFARTAAGKWIPLEPAMVPAGTRFRIRATTGRLLAYSIPKPESDEHERRTGRRGPDGHRAHFGNCSSERKFRR